MKASRQIASALIAFFVPFVAARDAFASDSFTYDMLGRLTSAHYDSGICIAYFYDANGNRTAVTTVATAPETAVWGSGHWGCFNWTP